MLNALLWLTTLCRWVKGGAKRQLVRRQPLFSLVPRPSNSQEGSGEFTRVLLPHSTMLTKISVRNPVVDAQGLYFFSVNLRGTDACVILRILKLSAVAPNIKLSLALRVGQRAPPQREGRCMRVQLRTQKHAGIHIC